MNTTSKSPNEEVDDRFLSGTCRDVAELAPWLLNGSLVDTVDQELRAHIVMCEGCSIRIQEAAEACWLLTVHVPSELLVQYAMDLDLDSSIRMSIEEHLIHCSMCQGELEIIGSLESQGEGEATPARRYSSDEHEAEGTLIPFRLRRAWRTVAVAASLLAVVGLTGWLVGPARELQMPAQPVASTTVESLAVVEEERAASISVGFFQDGFESGNTLAWSTADNSN